LQAQPNLKTEEETPKLQCHEKKKPESIFAPAIAIRRVVKTQMPHPFSRNTRKKCKRLQRKSTNFVKWRYADLFYKNYKTTYEMDQVNVNTILSD
jgi:hypothetical protein